MHISFHFFWAIYLFVYFLEHYHFFYQIIYLITHNDWYFKWTHSLIGIDCETYLIRFALPTLDKNFVFQPCVIWATLSIICWNSLVLFFWINKGFPNYILLFLAIFILALLNKVFLSFVEAFLEKKILNLWKLGVCL